MKPPRMDLEQAAAVLGVTGDAGAEALRAAYLQKLREHPPDRDPQQFEKVRDAYAMLADPDRRIAARLFELPVDQSFASLLDAEPDAREHVGPELWLDVLRRR